MTYAHDEAIELLKDANNIFKEAKKEYKTGSYALAVYLAYIAKGSFKVCANPIGVEQCDDLIDSVDQYMTGRAMVGLVKKNIVPTPNRVFREKIRSEEFSYLEALILSARAA